MLSSDGFLGFWGLFCLFFHSWFSNHAKQQTASLIQQMSSLARKALPHPFPPLLTMVGKEEGTSRGCFWYRYEELPCLCPITTGVEDGTENPGQTDIRLSSFPCEVVVVLPDGRRLGHEVLTQSQMSWYLTQGERGLCFQLVSMKTVPLYMENIKKCVPAVKRRWIYYF